MRTISRSLLAGLGLSLCVPLASHARPAAQSLTPGGVGSDLLPPSIVQAPVLSPNPNPRAPLAAILELGTDEPTQVRLVIKDGQRSWVVLAEAEYRLVHRAAVLGMRPGRTHQIVVTVRDVRGNETTWPQSLVFQTPQLPASFPPLQTTISQPARMEPGLTLFNANSAGSPSSFMVVVDAEGEVVWYYETRDGVGDARRLRSGNFLFLGGAHKLATEVDMLGNVVGQWYAANLDPTGAPAGAVLVAADTFHHEIVELPVGHPADFASLSTELRVYPDYPADEVDTTQTMPSANVIGDVIVEFKRSGEVVREIKLLDLLDPYRLSYNSLFNFWNSTYAPLDTKDWSHANAVVYAPFDDAYIVSARHQEAILKIHRPTGSLQWILGPHERWSAPWQQHLLTIVGGAFEWNYHQHAPQILPGGEILVFDNGNGRAVPPAPMLPPHERYSRAVHYRVNIPTMTIEQVWSYGPPPPAADSFFSGTRGDADRMKSTGNVLVTDSDRKDLTLNLTFARVFEVTRAIPGEIVFEIFVRDPSPTNPAAWNVYRAERLRGLYPHE